MLTGATHHHFTTMPLRYEAYDVELESHLLNGYETQIESQQQEVGNDGGQERRQFLEHLRETLRQEKAEVRLDYERAIDALRVHVNKRRAGRFTERQRKWEEQAEEIRRLEALAAVPEEKKRSTEAETAAKVAVSMECEVVATSAINKDAPVSGRSCLST